jgi:acetyl-CoA C-acetyltransferase
MSQDVFVAGVAMTPFGRRRDQSTPRDWVRQVARAAVADAGIEMSDVDALIISSETDFLTLQLVAAPLFADELALLPKPAVRVESGGASGGQAVRMAFIHLKAGVHRNVLVVGYEHAASHLSGDDVRTLYGLSFDADLEGFNGVTATALYALSIQSHMARFGTTAEQMAAVSVKNHGNAMRNPNAHKPMQIAIDDVLASPVVSAPYRVLDCSLISDGAAAVVLTSDSSIAAAGGRPRVRISASACATDHVRLGDRAEPGVFSSKAVASAQAYAQAGISRPSEEIAFAELYDAYTGAEIQGIEGLQLCKPGEAGPAMLSGMFDCNGPLPVNLSGGLIGQGGPPGATGVAQVATVTQLLQSRYHPDLQHKSDRRFGLADTHAGVGTLSVVHVLERMDG